MNLSIVSYHTGLPEQYKQDAVLLYEEAFGNKFSVAVKDYKQRINLIDSCMNPDYAIVAISDNKLLGIAGFHTTDGSLTGGITYKKLQSQLGFFKGNWAAFVFGLFSRKPAADQLVMDGIAVHKSARGKGIGSVLLDRVAEYAKEFHFKTVRLDVIDTNPRARKLYIGKDFKVIKTDSFPYLRWLLGFGASTRMELNI